MVDDYDHNPDNEDVANFVDASTLPLGEVWDSQAGAILDGIVACIVSHLEQAATEALEIKPLSRGGILSGVGDEKGGLSL
jgi:hypothetical protein